MQSPGWKDPLLHKIGSTINPKERLKAFQTPYWEPITFTKLYCLVLPGFDLKEAKSMLLAVEHEVHKYLSNFHSYIGGGTEFFLGDHKTILDKIEQGLLAISGNLSLIKTYCQGNISLLETVIDTELPLDNAITFTDEDIRTGTELNPLITLKQCYPGTNIGIRHYQMNALAAMSENKGKIILPPGTGKTIIMLLATRYFNKCLIMTPSILLVHQFRDECERYWKEWGYTTYYVCSEEEKITDWSLLPEKSIIVSTYQSSIPFSEIKFDIVLCDEAHHLTVENEESYYRHVFIHNNYNKIFFFTATEKCKKFTDGPKQYEFSMDHESFGKTLYKYTVEEAIRDGYLNDYNIVFHVYRNDSGEGEEMDKMKALGRVLKGGHIGNRILIKVNRIAKFSSIIDMVRIEHPTWYVDSIDSDTSRAERDKILTKFNTHKDISVLVICEVASEGWNEKSLDTVILYDVPISEIKLTQVSGRIWRIQEEKSRGNIIILCDKSTYTGKGKKVKRIYSSILKSHPIIQKRSLNLIALAKRADTETVKKFVTPIIVETSEITDYEEVYNSNVMLVEKGLSVEERFKMLLGYVDRESKLPTKGEPYIGGFLSDLNQSYKHKYVDGNTFKYSKRLDKWLPEVQLRELLWNKIQFLINLPKVGSPTERLEKLIEFVQGHNGVPKQKAEETENSLSIFWKNLRTFILNVEDGIGDVGYKNEIEELRKKVLKVPILQEHLLKTRNKRTIKRTPSENLALVREFIRINKTSPIRTGEEKGLNMFICNLRSYIINHYSRNGKKVCYKTSIESLAKSFIEEPLLRSRLDDNIIQLIIDS